MFLVLSLPLWGDEEIGVSQVSVFLGEEYLITFCSGERDPFEPLRKRLRTQHGKLRSLGVDYLMYAAMDVVIDEAYPILEMIGARIESLEDAVLAQPDNAALNTIHTTKRELLLLRRMLWPHREVINSVLRDDDKWISEHTKVYLRDCYDHVVQIMDLVDNYREMASGLLEVYLSSVSNRLNEVMRVFRHDLYPVVLYRGGLWDELQQRIESLGDAGIRMVLRLPVVVVVHGCRGGDDVVLLQKKELVLKYACGNSNRIERRRALDPHIPV